MELRKCLGAEQCHAEKWPVEGHVVGERDSSAKGLTALIALEAGGFDSCAKRVVVYCWVLSIIFILDFSHRSRKLNLWDQFLSLCKLSLTNKRLNYKYKYIIHAGFWSRERPFLLAMIDVFPSCSSKTWQRSRSTLTLKVNGLSNRNADRNVNSIPKK